MGNVRALFVSSLFLVLLSTSGACSSFDTTRVAAPQASLGNEIVRTFCERMAHEAFPSDASGERWKPVCRGTVVPPDDAPPQLVALMARREELADALDRVMPDGLHDDLATFLYQLLPLYDTPEERLPHSTRLLAALLDSFSQDAEALDALARLGTRTGYRPLRLGLGVVRPVLAYPELDALTEQTLAAINEGGTAHEEWSSLLAALAMESATYEPAEAEAGAPTTLALTRDLLLRSDDAIASGTPRYALVRDARGLARLRDGVVAAPFVDEDLDGLPDVDSLGRFVSASGELLDVPRPFRIRDEGAIPRDASGRALDSGTGQRIYDYVDVDPTLLAGVVREAQPWFSGTTPTMLDLTRGLPVLLGPEAAQTRTYGGTTLAYTGYDTSSGSAFDLVYALGEIARHEEAEETLRVVDALLRDHESAAAGVVHSGHYLLTRSDDYPDAALEQPSVLWDDLIRLLLSYDEQPGMVEALVRSFADERTRLLGPVYADFMRNRDVIDWDRSDINAPPTGLPFDEAVDRSAADVEGNESVFERTLALIDGLDGVRMCNKAGATLHISIAGINVSWPLIGSYDECELIDIANVDEAYVDAILGQFELELHDSTLNGLIAAVDDFGILNVDDLLEQASGIDGLTRHPTPQALSRLVFAAGDLRGASNCEDEDNPFVACLFDRLEDRHGRDVPDSYRGTIFAWETPGFFDGMTPMLSVLHDPRFRFDAEGRYTFGQLIRTLYRHWPTRSHWRTQRTDSSATTFSYQENARSYEDLVADGFADDGGRLLTNLVTATQTLDALELAAGRDGIDVLADAVHALASPDANVGLTTRDGQTEIRWNDGTNPSAVTPLQLLLLALRNVDRDFATSDGAARVDEWHRGRNAVVRQLLDTRTLGEGYQLTNRRGRAIVLLLLPFLIERLEAHREAGDLDSWARSLTSDAEDTLGGPLPVGVIRLFDQVQSDPEARDSLVALVAYLVDEASDNDAFLSTLYGATDMLQVLDDASNIVPVLRAASLALAPNARDLADGASGTPDVAGGVAQDSVGLLQRVQERDERLVLTRLLQNLVALDEDEGTALETILDVLSEVNRVSPGAGGSYDATDYGAAFESARDFMQDEEHGLERLYDVMQNRCVSPPCGEGSP